MDFEALAIGINPRIFRRWGHTIDIRLGNSLLDYFISG